MTDYPNGGELSPAVASACMWVQHAIADGQLEPAWLLSDPDWRLLLAQIWMVAEGLDAIADRDAVAAALAKRDQPASPHWARFANWYVGHLATTHSQLPRWGVLSTTEIAAPDVEVVTLVEEAVQGTIVVGQPEILVQRVTVRLGGAGAGTWRVCALGRSIPHPGWPPTADELTL